MALYLATLFLLGERGSIVVLEAAQNSKSAQDEGRVVHDAVKRSSLQVDWDAVVNLEFLVPFPNLDVSWVDLPLRPLNGSRHTQLPLS